MATIYTGSTTVTAVGGSTGYRFDAEVIENSTSTTNNTSNITCNLYCTGLNGYYYTNHGDPIAFINIDGERKATASVPNTSTSRQLICTWNGNITHNDDGTKAIRVTFNYNNSGDTAYYMPNNAKITAASVNLTTIARYATINSFTVAKKDETSLKFSFSASAVCDYIWYSINDGSSWTGVDIADAAGANFDVSGLTANTTYNCKIKVRRKDSQLTGDPSSRVQQSTYDYPHIVTNGVGSNPLVIGNQQTLTLYNPIPRTVTIKMYKTNTSGTELYSGTTNVQGTNVAFSFTPNANTLYSSVPNNPDAYCVYSVIYGSSTRTTATSTYKYQIIGTETPTFAASNWTYTANLTALTGNNQKLINNQSTVTFSINTPATAKNGASISKYILKWGEGHTKDSTVGWTVEKGNGLVLTVIAVDSRGLTKETTKTISTSNFIDYKNININNDITTNRNNGIDTETHLNMRGTFYNVNFGSVTNNLYSAKYYVSQTTTFSGNGKTIPVSEFTISNGNFSLSNYNIHANYDSGGFPIGQSYYIKVVVTDAQGLLSSYEIISRVNDGKIARDVYQDNSKEYHEGINGLADSNYTQTINGTLNVTDNLYINPHRLSDRTRAFHAW